MQLKLFITSPIKYLGVCKCQIVIFLNDLKFLVDKNINHSIKVNKFNENITT